MASAKFLFIALLAIAFGVEGSYAIFWWLWPFTSTTTTTTTSSSSSSSASGSNYVVNVGNRENTNTSLTDYGTMISNLQINLARFNGTALLSNPGAADGDQLSLLIYTLSEEYRKELETLVAAKSEWFQQRLAEAQEFATTLQQFGTQILLKSFAEDVRGNLATLNGTQADCLNRQLDVGNLVDSVVSRSGNGCLRGRIDTLLNLREAARRNLSQLFDPNESIEDQLDQCNGLEDSFADDLEDLYRDACISSVLFKERSKTFRLDLTVAQATEAADLEFGQARAQLLDCVADLESHAFNATLGLRYWINNCLIFRVTKDFRDVYCLKSLYCSLVRSILEYASAVWSPFYQNGADRIEALQRRFMRYALRHLNWFDPFHLPSYENRCNIISLDTLQARRAVTRALFVSDILTSKIDCPSLLESINISVRPQGLRNRNLQLYTPLRQNNYGANSALIGSTVARHSQLKEAAMTKIVPVLLLLLFVSQNDATSKFLESFKRFFHNSEEPPKQVNWFNYLFGNRRQPRIADHVSLTINGVTFNVDNLPRNVTLTSNDTEVRVFQTQTGTVINIGTIKDGGSTPGVDVRTTTPSVGAGVSTTTSTTATTLSTSTSTAAARRRKRQLFELPQLPSNALVPPMPKIPIPTISGTTIAFGDRKFNLPESVLNITKSLPGVREPWELLDLLLKQPGITTFDIEQVTDYLQTQYETVGKPLVSQGTARLNGVFEFLSNAVHDSLNGVEKQLNDAIAMAAIPFKFTIFGTKARQCMVEKFRAAGAGVVSKAVGCIRDRWTEARGVVGNFSQTVNATDATSSNWFEQLSECCYYDDEEEERKCYAKAIANPALTTLWELPTIWVKQIARTTVTVNSFQPLLTACTADLMIKIPLAVGQGAQQVFSCMWA
ncbi:uncharacterized protein LOC129759966 [Uranotaenia lowii]|uniref:uncharacterized protein LOC129759966 n=1 Tax=Uranotaenia lowii TaxID=190385 RepID=UPI0024785592|nr:uncharacterized protein LOC129759966 [Uranotaenia lowii]